MDILEKGFDLLKQKNCRILFWQDPEARERGCKRTLRKNIISTYRSDLSEPIEKGQIIISHGSLHRGFEYGMIDFVIISDKEVFGEERKRKVKKNQRLKLKVLRTFP